MCVKKMIALYVAVAVMPVTVFGQIVVKMVPDESVLATVVNQQKGYFDLMLQTIVVVNQGSAPAEVTGLKLGVDSDVGENVSVSIPMTAVVAQTQEFAGMQQQGLGVFLAAQLLNSAGLGGAVHEDARLGNSATLAPGEALIATSRYLVSRSEPVSASITVDYQNTDGEAAVAQTILPVKLHVSPFNYRAPLQGAWLMRAAPAVHSHHRFIPSNEFALDFFKTGPDGALDKAGDRSATDDYGWGEPVLAAEEGEVVFVINGQVQTPENLSRRDGESVAAARQRITAYQMRRFADDFRAAAAGNMITLRHEKNGRIEYSSYAHLKEDSLKVRVGDKVHKGQPIAAVGNTGDSTLTHLHFQLNAGADAFYSRSLPVDFENDRSLYIGQDPGRFMLFE